MAADMADLANEMADLRDRYPNLKDDELFVLWFLTAYVVDNPDVAANALVGSSRDKSVDAILIDHDADRVAIVQGKYSTIGKSAEGRPDVIAFSDLADVMADDDRFATWLQDSAPAARERMNAARQAVLKKQYALRLFYVTTRSVSAALRAEAEKRARTGTTHLTVLQRSDVLSLLRDYLDSVAPPVPMVELPIETAPASGVISRFDPQTEITSWIFSAKANDVADLYKIHGTKIFARNIRGYLGQGDESSVNSAIRHTLAKDPLHFWYFNNGVTIACDEAQQIGGGGKQVLQMHNPQIVNGQQTTVTLGTTKVPGNASVLVRVVALPKNQYDLIDEIVKATNRQNRFGRRTSWPTTAHRSSWNGSYGCAATTTCASVAKRVRSRRWEARPGSSSPRRSWRKRSRPATSTRKSSAPPERRSSTRPCTRACSPSAPSTTT